MEEESHHGNVLPNLQQVAPVWEDGHREHPPTERADRGLAPRYAPWTAARIGSSTSTW